MAVDSHLLEGEAEWKSQALFALYNGLGWLAFVAWSISFYPQVLLNYRRKSVEGLNFDFVVFNLTKHTTYCIFNVVLHFSPFVQREYHTRYGERELIPVSASDVAFSVHAVTLTAVTAMQLLIYPKGGQIVSRWAILISSIAWTVGLFAVAMAIDGELTWLSAVTVFNYIQLVMTSIKYFPQAWMNYKRCSTVGWSIGNILLDLTGGIAGLSQMFIQSIDQGSFQNFAGNVGKLGLTSETILFDVLFIVQHYCLYAEKHRPSLDNDVHRGLLSSSNSSTVPLLRDQSDISPGEGMSSRQHHKRHMSNQDLEKAE